MDVKRKLSCSTGYSKIETKRTMDPIGTSVIAKIGVHFLLQDHDVSLNRRRINIK